MNQPEMEILGLKFNPFEPAASGAPVKPYLWIPDRWRDQINSLLDAIESGRGVKAIAILGEYGSGKTYLMRWLELEEFPKRRIKPFFFDNPGVQFYDLANNLLRQIGRYEFSKTLWEYLRPNISPLQLSLFDTKDNFISWLTLIKKQKKQQDAIAEVSKAIRASQITSDEEISFRFAKVIIETIDKPYFEYRDFIAGRKDAIVAEREEANYFSAIIRTLKMTSSVSGVAFLLDEFEEISLQKRLNRKEAQDYLATLKRLLNVANQENFWLILSMTPQAADISRQIEPSLWDRFTGQGQYQFTIPELSTTEAEELIVFRLEDSYLSSKYPRLWPFTPDVIGELNPVTYSSPRRLIKVAFYALTEAARNRVELPFTVEFIRQIEAKVYPRDN